MPPCEPRVCGAACVDANAFDAPECNVSTQMSPANCITASSDGAGVTRSISFSSWISKAVENYT